MENPSTQQHFCSVVALNDRIFHAIATLPYGIDNQTTDVYGFSLDDENITF
jgi:hypothetical protein